MALKHPLDALLFEHPRSVGETYPQHFTTAWTFGARMLGGAFAAFVHGVVPALFTTTAGDTVRKLHAQLVSRVDSYRPQ